MPLPNKAEDFINLALRMLGVLQQGDVAGPSEAEDGLVLLNLMMDAWGIEGLMPFNEVIGEYSLVVGTQSYTIGAGGTFNTARPIRIDYASIVILTNPAQPLELPIPVWTDAQWQQYQVKNLQSSYPLGLYDDGGFPLRTLTYWPIPAQACKTRLYTPTALQQFADLVTTYTFPPGYTQAILKNLAVELAGGGFAGNLTPVIIAGAAASKREIKSSNTKPYYTACDPTFMGRDQVIGAQYDWRTNRPVGNP